MHAERFSGAWLRAMDSLKRIGDNMGDDRALESQAGYLFSQASRLLAAAQELAAISKENMRVQSARLRPSDAPGDIGGFD